MDKGFHASQVGILLAVSNLLSCFLQPIIGDFVDRLKSFKIPQILTGFLSAALICYGVIHVYCHVSYDVRELFYLSF